MQYATLT